jgi:DNA-binding NarL/FixJ family response regulator
MGIKEGTVKAHLSSVFRKLNVRDRIQLVLRCRADEQGSNDFFSVGFEA